MTHIINGQSTLSVMERAGVAGAMFSMDDILMEGPVPNCLASPQDWSFRAGVLQDQFGIPAGEYLHSVQLRQEFLETACAAPEVVLWFEEDLFCQINFLHLLDWFARNPPAGGRLSTICPEDDRLGTLTPEALAALLPDRRPVTSALLQTASEAWQAYCSSSPAALGALAEAPIPTWPLLQRGLKCHLQRFPSTKSGLNVLEEEILTLLNDGPLTFGELFGRVNSSLPVRPYGLGDLQVMQTIIELAAPAAPLLLIEGWQQNHLNPAAQETLRSARLEVTPAATHVLAGQKDWCKMRPLDRWLGGVHLVGAEPSWRWDDGRGCLVGC